MFKKLLQYTVVVLCLIALVWTCLPASVQARADKLFEEFCVFRGGVLINPREVAKSDDDGYYYGAELNDYGTTGAGTDTGAGKIIGGAAKKVYGFGIDVSIPANGAAPFTGDSNVAALRTSIKNYDGNDTSFVMNGISIQSSNRSGGTLGYQSNEIGVANRGTAPNLTGLHVRAENYGMNATAMTGLDIELSNEGAKATTEYGLKIRNTNNSLTTQADAAICISETGTNTGFAAQIITEDGPKIFSGTAATGAAVYAEVGAIDATGSMYMSTTGIFVQVANTGAETDWERVDSTDSD